MTSAVATRTPTGKRRRPSTSDPSSRASGYAAHGSAPVPPTSAAMANATTSNTANPSSASTSHEGGADRDARGRAGSSSVRSRGGSRGATSTESRKDPSWPRPPRGGDVSGSATSRRVRQGRATAHQVGRQGGRGGPAALRSVGDMNTSPGPAPDRRRPPVPPVPPDPAPRPTLGETVRSLSWPLVLGLGALALVRPLLMVLGVDGAIGRPAAPLLVTLVLTVVWVAAIVVARPAHPLATGVAVGLVYGCWRSSSAPCCRPCSRGAPGPRRPSRGDRPRAADQRALGRVRWCRGARRPRGPAALRGRATRSRSLGPVADRRPHPTPPHRTAPHHPADRPRERPMTATNTHPRPAVPPVPAGPPGGLPRRRRGPLARALLVLGFLAVLLVGAVVAVLGVAWARAATSTAGAVEFTRPLAVPARSGIAHGGRRARLRAGGASGRRGPRRVRAHADDRPERRPPRADAASRARGGCAST